MDSNNIALTKDVVKAAKSQFKDDDKAYLLDLIPQTLEVLSLKLKLEIKKAKSKKETSCPFFNFWNIHWQNLSIRNNTDVKSNFVTNSSAITITKRFLEAGEVLTPEIDRYFHQVITKAPNYLNSLLDFTEISRNGNYPKELSIGQNFSYLIRVIFSTILKLTYEDKLIVEIKGLGNFQRKFKIKNKQTASSTKGGLLHFEPQL